MISKEELDRLGLPENSLKIKHPHTGEEGYRAAVEVFHQLHCLNLIRQAIYKDYYKNQYSDVSEADSKEDLQGHVGKCAKVGSGPRRPELTGDRPLHRNSENESHVPERYRNLHLPSLP